MKRRPKPEPDELAKARQRKRMRIVAGRFGMLLLLGFAVWGVAFLSEDISRMGLGMKFGDLVASYSPGQGFPVDLPDESILQMSDMGKDVAILSDVSLSMYNSTGKETARIVHGYQNPIISTSGDRAIIFDREGQRLALYSRTEEIWEKTTTHPIVWANLAENGNVAVVTGGDYFEREVVVFDAQGEEMFLWDTSQLVWQVVLSRRGDTMLSLSTEADAGVLSSRITALDFSSETPLCEIMLKDQMALSVDFVGAQDEQLQIITEKGVYAYNLDGEQIASYSFGNRILNRFVNGPERDGGAYVLLDEVGDGRHLVLVSLSDELEVIGQTDINTTVIDMKCQKDGICIFTEGRVNYYNRDVLDSYDIGLYGVMAIESAGSTVYTAGIDGLNLTEIDPPK